MTVKIDAPPVRDYGIDRMAALSASSEKAWEPTAATNGPEASNTELANFSVALSKRDIKKDFNNAEKKQNWRNLLNLIFSVWVPTAGTNGTDASGENTELTNFSVAHSKRDIEEDLFSIAVTKPPRRLKKRTSTIQ